MELLADKVVRRFLAFKNQPKESKKSKIDRLAKFIRDKTGVGIGVAKDMADAVIRNRDLDRLAHQKGWPASNGHIEGPKGNLSFKDVKQELETTKTASMPFQEMAMAYLRQEGLSTPKARQWSKDMAKALARVIPNARPVQEVLHNIQLEEEAEERVHLAFSQVPVKWVNSKRAEFEVIGKDLEPQRFAVSFHPQKGIYHKGRDERILGGYKVDFFRTKDEGAPWQWKMVEDPNINPIKVFSGVITAVKEFLKAKKPIALGFVADEANRARLYDRLLSKMVIPGYTGEIMEHGKYVILKESR